MKSGHSGSDRHASCEWMWSNRIPQLNSLFFLNILGDVLYYNWKVPEGERHDSALKRNKEALTQELKLWEGYLAKVTTDRCRKPNSCMLDVRNAFL